MNADPYRYRPLAQALRAQRGRLNPQWENWGRAEAREAQRLRSAQSDYVNRPVDTAGDYRDTSLLGRVTEGAYWPYMGGAGAGTLWAIGQSRKRVGDPSVGWRKRSRDGTYDAGEDVLPTPAAGGGAAPGRGASGPRPPKRWVNPDQPWPHATAANGGGPGSGRARRGGKIRGSARIERY